MRIKYDYMILYLFPNGSGRGFITRNKRIKTIKDVEDLDIFLRSDDYDAGLPRDIKNKIYVSDFKLLRTYIGK